ncbi:hypothetical protein [Cellulophaga sp. L1A9]|uniref:hypothetical protein n=1 Tax=Cellulophaga sp. L1A9 TaxID=2686362 RepID=UPI00131B0C1B|nr:hypothetical protein [Cellulophaga sp. L1A9]
MFIVKFGTYSLKIKSYTAKEVGLKDAHANMTFIIFQKILHFWFVPLIPVDKFWIIKDSHTGKQITETTSTMRAAIDLKLIKQRTPIWSYFGLILITLPFLVFFMFGVYLSVDKIIDEVQGDIVKNNRVDLKKELVKNPQINDLYTFKTIYLDKVTDENGYFVNYKPSHFSSSSKIDYSVNYISRDSVGFEFLKDKKYSTYTFGLKEVFRLSKKDLILATKGYRELEVYEYQKKPNSKSKEVVGVFEINRAQE